MDESTHLLSWLLRNTLERHYAGNKSLMAKDLGIDRHTLWRTFRVGDGEKGHISSLVAQQLLWCCMQHDYSLDDSIHEYVEQNFQESAQQCKQVKDWIQNAQAGNLDNDSRMIVAIIKQVIPEWTNILECNQLNGRQSKHPIQCKFMHACPIVKIMEIVQAESRRFDEVNLLLDS